LQVLGIDLGENFNTVVNWANSLGLSYPILVDIDYSVWNQYGMGYIPHNVIIDTDMVVRYTEIGYNENQVLDVLQTYLPATSGPYIWYADHILDDTLGNNNGRADDGETVNLVVTLENIGLEAANVSATLTVHDAEVQIITDTIAYGNMASETSAANSEQPFSFSIDPSSIAHIDTFNLDITADGGYARQESFEMVVGASDILLVDDDGGESYEIHYAKPLRGQGVLPLEWDSSVRECPSEEIQKYDTVLWFTGDDRQNTLTAEEQVTIAAFLERGGKLFISGQNIGYDLVEDGSASDSAFFANYLHAQYISDGTKVMWANGVSGDPISSSIKCFFAGDFGGVQNQTPPDVISPIATAEKILRYSPGSGCAGLRYEDENTGAKLVYLAFGFEGISGPKEDSASNLMKRVIAWLGGTTGVEKDWAEATVPPAFSLRQNYPNPFNPQTTIEYELPKSAHVRLIIYNELGRHIRTLVNSRLSAGRFQTLWDGTDEHNNSVAAGVYFCHLQTEGATTLIKLVLVK